MKDGLQALEMAFGLLAIPREGALGVAALGVALGVGEDGEQLFFGALETLKLMDLERMRGLHPRPPGMAASEVGCVGPGPRPRA